MFELKFENVNNNIIDINDEINYEVLAISGLTPPPATIFSSKSPNQKGEKYNGSTLDARNIIISIKILGDIEENRNALYDWINTEQYIKIYYKNGTKNIFVIGHIEECDIDLFTDNEIIDLSIYCDNPYLMDLQAIVTDISNIKALFTFPFAIDEKGIPFSMIIDNNETYIRNDGAETGILIKIFCGSELKNITMYNANNTTEKFTIKTTIIKNSTIIIDTDNSPKTCIVYKPNGTTENLLKYCNGNIYNESVTLAPYWLKLRNGNNKFGFIAESGGENAVVNISFNNKFLGV